MNDEGAGCGVPFFIQDLKSNFLGGQASEKNIHIVTEADILRPLADIETNLGFAFASIKQGWSITDTNNNNLTESFSSDKTRWGGVFGVGAEWAWTANWSLRTEALYMIFKEETASGFSAAGAQNVSFDLNNNVFVARAAVNYRFGGGY